MSLTRRQFLTAAILTLGMGTPMSLADSKPSERRIMTVTGPIDADGMGLALSHEHVLVDFIGAERATRDRYDSEEAYRTILPRLQEVAALGVATLVECTPEGLGRNPTLLARLARSSNLNILMPTGNYAAAGGRYLPAHVRSESAQQLAARWIREWKFGIEDTAIKPGFIKIGMDAGAPGEVQRKLLRAAAIAHRATGMIIASHTGDGVSALAQLDFLRTDGIREDAWIWVHAQTEANTALLIEAARRGAWVELDAVAPHTVSDHLDRLRLLKREGLLGRVLLSHDAGWYRVGEAGGGRYQPHTALFTHLKPQWTGAGLTEAEFRLVMVENPARAFAVGLRGDRSD